MNRASVLLLATALVLCGGLWWFFSRMSASGDARSLPADPSPVAESAEAPSVGAPVARTERESVPVPETPAAADETPHVPIPDPNKPFDLVDNIDWHLEQLRLARERGDFDKQIACCNLLWGMCVGAVMDARGEYVVLESGMRKVDRTPRDAERFSYNNREYLASEPEFPEFVAFVRWGREFYEAEGKSWGPQRSSGARAGEPQASPKREIPQQYLDALQYASARARELGIRARQGGR